MTNNARHVLLVSYDFPPNTGIAGRRWGHLARGMADRGWQVHVIKAAALPGGDTSAWSAVVEHPNIHVRSLPRRYPKVLTHQPWCGRDESLLRIIHYHAALAWVRLAYPGTPYDISLGWEPILLPCVQEIVDANPLQWIFATGAPWDMLRVLALHKSRHPRRNLRLWFDFRDPWLHDQPDYGIQALSVRRMSQEKNKARIIMDHADVISAPNMSILEGFTQAEVPPRRNTQQIVLRHFHATTEPSPGFTPPADGAIRIVYGGAVYSDCSPYLEALAIDLDKLREHQPEIYARLRIDFYTDEQSVIKGIFSRHSVVRAVPPIGMRIFAEVAAASWCMILAPARNKNCFTTKYYEFQKAGTPYLHVGEHGAVSQTIVHERRGLDWKSFLSESLAGTPPDPAAFEQTASNADSLDQRINEIEACMELAR